MFAEKRCDVFVSVVMVFFVCCGLFVGGCSQAGSGAARPETKAQRDKRMQWWRGGRFGMFIHWGVYAVPAGEWKGTTDNNVGEWIKYHRQIPTEEYRPLAGQFNPVKFNAKEWVSLAKRAGMKYIVITSKHHDGFCMFDSKLTDYDIVEATPFKRDVLKELTEACRESGIKMCFYYSIMDWNHADYLPHRKWETQSTEGADYNRYVAYMKGQLKELIDNYDPAILWFDGEWEGTWTSDRGSDLCKYLRGLKPDLIINNRIDKGRSGMAGMNKEGNFVGDYGTPEQEIPATGLAGVDWESCMTMNNTWGYKKSDHNWKSAEVLIRNLVDIASKGGNYLLNVGPTAEGLIPQASVERLEAMGKWLAVNGESIYGTSANPIGEVPWGRCTAKCNKLYLHVFDWPADGKLVISGLDKKVSKAYLLAGGEKLAITTDGGLLTISLPAEAVDKIDTVVVLKTAK
jgi:alpha-L-fucosidase